MKQRIPIAAMALACCAFALLLSGSIAAQTMGSPERFSAVAASLGSPGRAGAGRVEIVVNRWSTEAERQRLLDVLFEKGPDRLLDALTDLPRTGYIRTPNSIGYDLHFADRHPLPEGGEQVILATDRYITFWEAANRPRSIGTIALEDYQSQPVLLSEVRREKP